MQKRGGPTTSIPAFASTSYLALYKSLFFDSLLSSRTRWIFVVVYSCILWLYKFTLKFQEIFLISSWFCFLFLYTADTIKKWLTKYIFKNSFLPLPGGSFFCALIYLSIFSISFLSIPSLSSSFFFFSNSSQLYTLSNFSSLIKAKWKNSKNAKIAGMKVQQKNK